jgi:hypothetical protein
MTANIAVAITKNKRSTDMELANNKQVTQTQDDSKLKELTHTRIKTIKFSKEIQKYASQSRMVKKDATKSKMLY